MSKGKGKDSTMFLVLGIAGVGVLAWVIGQQIGGAAPSAGQGAPSTGTGTGTGSLFGVGSSRGAGESLLDWYNRASAGQTGPVTWPNGTTTGGSYYGPSYADRYRYDGLPSTPSAPLPVAGTDDDSIGVHYTRPRTVYGTGN